MKRSSVVAFFAVLFAVGAAIAAITHGAATRADLAQAILDDVDAGAGAGMCILLTSGDSPLDTVTLQDPAFARSNDTLTCNGVPLEGVAAATGTIAKFKVTDSDGNAIFQGSVTATGGGGDLTVDNTSVEAAQTVRLTSLKYVSAP